MGRGFFERKLGILHKTIMIESVLAIGLVLSVCDTWSINASAINALVYPAVKQPIMQTGDEEFDVPLQIATWDDLYDLYRMDVRSTQRRVPKLTNEHLKPSKLKMKKFPLRPKFLALHVEMWCLNASNNIYYQKVPPAQLIYYYSWTTLPIVSIKQPSDSLKGAVTPKSIHFEYWHCALLMLDNMFFVDKFTGEKNNRSSVLKKFESTIRGYWHVAERCFSANIKNLNRKYLASFIFFQPTNH